MDLELKSDAATVFLEIAGQVRRVNRRRNETLYGVVRFSDHGIFLRWHNLLPVEGPTAEDPFQTGEALTNMLLFVLQTEEQAKAETEAHTRVRITNGITGETTIVESRRAAQNVFLDLRRLARQVNARKDDMLRAAVGLSRGFVSISWWCPWITTTAVAAQTIDLVAPLHQVDQILWPRPSQDVTQVSP